MNRTVPLVAVSILLCACTSGGPFPSDTPVSEARRAELRAALSGEMSEHRVRRYRDAWTVLADGAEVAPGRIRLFYTRRVVPAEDRASGPDQDAPDHWNREHVWPQSFGLKGNAARSDLHNLVPVDRTVNAARGNKLFGEGTAPHRECTPCRVSRETWEPAPEVQGDVARIVFYMDVRYEGGARDGVPDLVLADAPAREAARFGRLTTLARWHCADPVSAEERQRHEAVARAQGNRNVFVDDPLLAGAVFGFSCPRRPEIPLWRALVGRATAWASAFGAEASR